jgi:hypothetical protein
VIARCADPAEDVAQLGIIIEQPEQGLSARAPLAYASAAGLRPTMSRFLSSRITPELRLSRIVFA